ncbi:MAG TPA: oligopeptide/dipeptide ABC transporter ATP-binding protein, partial [Chloroflexota bacterium]|nr:oligopeptide/dipeptide ABC transporter ATP-binding protein [Chloroflexota bacterium]
SVPQLEVQTARLAQIPGQQPSPANRPSGCPFHPRCYLHQGRAACVEQPPPLYPTDTPSHVAACHFWPEVQAGQEVG